MEFKKVIDQASSGAAKAIFILIVSLFVYLTISIEAESNPMAKKLVSVDFEVFGLVQGVFFRKYTQQQATKLDLKGWCMNTESGTVKGVMEGNPSKIQEMKIWLEKTGSPKSRIDKAIFGNEKEIKSFSSNTFQIRR